jgi:non-ribosomal peptide synthetase component F
MNGPSKLSTKLPPEQEAIRAKCFHPTGTFVEFKKEEVEQSIPDRFEQQVAKYPDRIAVKTKADALTDAELNQAVNRVAHAILDQSELRLLIKPIWIKRYNRRTRYGRERRHHHL